MKIIKILMVGICLTLFFFIGRSRLAEFYYGQGNELYDRHLYKEAADYFKKAVRLYPSKAILHHALADAYLGGKSEGKAVEEYKKTLQLDRRFTEAYQALARIYFQKEAYGEALELLKKAEVALPSDPHIKGLKEQASFAFLFNAGEKAYGGGKGAEGREFLNKALKVNPHSAHTYYLLAFYEKQNNFVQAAEHLKEAIRLSPKFYLAHSLLGDIYFENGSFEEAVKWYQSSLAIHGSDLAVLNNLGIAYMNLERYGSAIPYLQKAVELDPSNIKVRYNLAAVCRDHGDLEKAVREFVRVTQMQFNYPNVHNDLGDIYKHQKKEAAAGKEYRISIEQYRQRLSKAPSDPLALVELAQAYNGVKEYSKAKTLLEKALTLDPDYQKAYLVLANVYRNLDRPKDALGVLSKAHQLSPQKYSYVQAAILDANSHLAGQLR